MSIMLRGVVESISDDPEGKRVAVAFTKFAAIYYLSKEHSRFDDWLGLLISSRDHGEPVEFDYRDEGQELTAIKAIIP